MASTLHFHLNHICKIKDHLCAPCAHVFKGNFSALCEKELLQFHGFLMLPTEQNVLKRDVNHNSLVNDIQTLAPFMK